MFIMSTQISLPKISLILQKMKVNLVNGHKHPFSGKHERREKAQKKKIKSDL